MDDASKKDLRRWVANHEAAARRERADARENIPTPGEAYERVFRLAAFARGVHGWPPRKTDAELQEDLARYACWDKLRARWRVR